MCWDCGQGIKAMVTNIIPASTHKLPGLLPEETVWLVLLLNCEYFFVLPPAYNLVLSREVVAVNGEIKQTPPLGTSQCLIKKNCVQVIPNLTKHLLVEQSKVKWLLVIYSAVQYIIRLIVCGDLGRAILITGL